MGRKDGRPWGETLAASGEIQWPPMGRFPWPPSHGRRFELASAGDETEQSRSRLSEIGNAEDSTAVTPASLTYDRFRLSAGTILVSALATKGRSALVAAGRSHATNAIVRAVFVEAGAADLVWSN